MELVRCERDGPVDTHHGSEYASMRIMLMGNRHCHALTLQRKQIETSSDQYRNVQLWGCYTCKDCYVSQIKHSMCSRQK